MQKFVIASIVGAIIGYITNWLAIKMLFRPKEEKRILGFRIPFTPGLIPKERQRIAKSVGETIGTHLLSKETIVEALYSEKMMKQIKMWVSEKVNEAKKSNVTIKEELKIFAGEKYENYFTEIKGKTVKFLIRWMKRADNKETISTFIKKIALEKLEKNPSVILESEFYKKITENIIDYAKECRNSEDLSTNIEKWINEKVLLGSTTKDTLQQVIPSSLINSAKMYVYGKNHEIAMGLKEMLKRDNMQEKLKKAIGDMISGNVNPLVSMFLNNSAVHEKVIFALEEYLDGEENQKEIALLLNEVIDKVMETKISEIIEEVSDEGRNNNIEAIKQIFLQKIITEEAIEKINYLTQNKLLQYSSIREIFELFHISPVEIVDKITTEQVEYIMNGKEIEEYLTIGIDLVMNEIIGIPVKKIMTGNEEKVTLFTIRVVENIFARFVEKKAVEVIEILDVSKIVENKINSFDVTFAEKIILEIASKELSAITWLGALLGAIMGLLSPFLNALTS